MPETWPLSLQQLLNTAGFQEDFGDQTLESDMDIGPSKKRARSTHQGNSITGSILADATAYTNFKNFFKTTLNNGVNTFYFNHPITGEQTTYRFKGSPRVTPVGSGGVQWNISFAWEEMP